MKIKNIYKKAAKLQKTIVFPEAEFSDRTLQAVKIIAKKKIAKPILIGDESGLVLRDKSLLGFQIINPKTFEHLDRLVKSLYAKRKEKGLSLEEAKELALNPYYFATLLVEEGYADGMVAGAEASTANTVRPALQIIKAQKKGSPVNSCFLVYGKNKFLKDKALILADCGVLPCPTADEIAQIASDSVKTFNTLGLGQPKVAFLSFSSKGSAKHESADKMAQAYEKFKKSGICCDGELQFDSAMVPKVAASKAPNSAVKGDANILIFPDLNSGNICYKAIQYIGGLNAVGPILQGLKKPVNDLSRGCSVEDIVTITAITALQAEKE